MKEQEIRRQFRAAVNIQNKQYKILKEQLLTRTSKADQKAMLAKLKEEQDRRLSMLSDQYEQSIAEVKQHQHVSMECMAYSRSLSSYKRLDCMSQRANFFGGRRGPQVIVNRFRTDI